jgi:hypothetical protein
MANRKYRLSKPSKASAGLNNKVRFKFEGEKAGYFIVANPKRKAIDGKKFKNHDEALAFAIELQNS